jgi:hypothetical protein
MEMMIWRKTKSLRESLEKTPIQLLRALRRREIKEQPPQTLLTSQIALLLRDRSQSKPRLMEWLLKTPLSPPNSLTSPTGSHPPPRLRHRKQLLPLLKIWWVKREYFREARIQFQKIKNRLLNRAMFLNLTQGNE